MIEKICPPALLYLGFSMIQITIDLFQGEYSTSLLKFIVITDIKILFNKIKSHRFKKVKPNNKNLSSKLLLGDDYWENKRLDVKVSLS